MRHARIATCATTLTTLETLEPAVPGSPGSSRGKVMPGESECVCRTWEHRHDTIAGKGASWACPDRRNRVALQPDARCKRQVAPQQKSIATISLANFSTFRSTLHRTSSTLTHDHLQASGIVAAYLASSQTELLRHFHLLTGVTRIGAPSVTVVSSCFQSRTRLIQAQLQAQSRRHQCPSPCMLTAPRCIARARCTRISQHRGSGHRWPLR
jgi:hypothetical protein